MANQHRFWIKQGHSAFGVVLSDDEDDGGDSGRSSILPDGSIAPFSQGLPHPYLQDKAYFSGLDNRKMSALPTENSAVSQDQFPEPNLQPNLSHTHQAKAAPRRVSAPTPRPG